MSAARNLTIDASLPFRCFFVVVIDFYFLCLCFSVCMCRRPHACRPPRGGKEILELLDLELEAVVSCYVGTRDGSWPGLHRDLTMGYRTKHC